MASSFLMLECLDHLNYFYKAMQDSQASNKKTIRTELQFSVFCALLSSNLLGKLDIPVAAAV